MSDIMTPIPFGKFMDWILTERKKEGTVFGTHEPFQAGERTLSIFGRNLETPIGPAAGPHTQLAQNIIAAYCMGSRFFELKTVQIMDGEALSKCVGKPCILAGDEGYNCEWSTELYVWQAQAEYIKAWFALHVLAKEFSLGAQDGFQFHISVGYDLAGIQSEKINHFIESMMEAKEDATFIECKRWLLQNHEKLSKFTKEDAEAIPSAICNSVTISTLHGCPPAEIERIADYLLEEKGLHTFVKLNPTLLGYEFARKTMDDMGYDYMVFGDFHFQDDLQYKDAVPMLTRLMALAEKRGLEFGVKITNTFPVDVTRNELPSEEMYMSGKALFPLSISLAAKLSREFDGKLRISYSGGADFFNIEKIAAAGVWPVTMATTLLKPGGYARMKQLAETLEVAGYKAFTGIDVEALSQLAAEAIGDVHYRKSIKPQKSHKMEQTVPLTDCFVAPCEEGCPIHQDITTYMKLVGEGNYEEALTVITEKNPLPFITGTICAHHCMGKCTRNFYEEPVNIRRTKLEAAKGGYKALMAKRTAPAVSSEQSCAVIGGGPAGLSAAYFLAKNGMAVTIFEKEGAMGGVVRNVIPGFRIEEKAIQQDVALVESMGVKMVTGKEIKTLEEVNAFDFVVISVGAGEKGTLNLEEGKTMNAIDFLWAFKERDGMVPIGKQVAVIGGGNTAMDTARAAKRTKGVEKVSLIYRRTKRYMPAEEEELLLAEAEGVEFVERLSPVKFADGILVCKKMKLGAIDKSGRAGVEETSEEIRIPADTVIAAVGENVPGAFYRSLGLETDERGCVKVNPDTLETSKKQVYAAGDGVRGAATVVEAIRDGRKAAEAILGVSPVKEQVKEGHDETLYAKRGMIRAETAEAESGRCLSCSRICESCVEVCPNRANLSIKVPGMKQNQVVHVDSMCNECGNCKVFCPYISAPYLDKFTVFANEADMENSQNEGFTVLNIEKGVCKVRLLGAEYSYQAGETNSDVPKELGAVIDTIVKDYRYIL